MACNMMLRVDNEIKNSLKKFRRYERETYGDILKRILKRYEKEKI